ncbi:MAG: hypothetical protein SGBAC_013603 [Bacillariaceae sp.]
MKVTTVLSLACLLILSGSTLAVPAQQDRNLRRWGFSSGYDSNGANRDSFPEEDLVSITCDAEFECSCNGGDATFVCREKTCNDGTTRMKAKCVGTDRARPDDVCGCCGEECPSRNKHNTFDKWDEDFYDDEDDEDDQSEVFEADPTTSPTKEPSPAPTIAPVVDPTPVPTTAPVVDPTPVPTTAPVADPTEAPTLSTPVPTVAPSPSPPPTPEPSPSPTIADSNAPSDPPAPRPIDPFPTAAFVVAQDDSDEPLPEDTIAVTAHLGTSVTFTITQKWKSTDSVSWIAPAYDQAAGDMYCEENDKQETVGYNEVNSYTALCDGDTATIDIFVHDGSFEGDQANIRGCNGWGSGTKILYYSITLACDASAVTTSTATFDSGLEFPLGVAADEVPTTSPTLRTGAFGGSEVEQPAGLDEEIKMRRIYLGAGASLVVLILLAVILKMLCCRKPKKSAA